MKKDGKKKEKRRKKEGKKMENSVVLKIMVFHFLLCVNKLYCRSFFLKVNVR
jgi:hypothetical protein